MLRFLPLRAPQPLRTLLTWLPGRTVRTALAAAGATVMLASAQGETLALPAPHLPGQVLPALWYPPPGTAGAPSSAAGSGPTGAAAGAPITGRHPAVVMLHGCGGVGAQDQPNARHRMWAEWLQARGHAVLFPLSFTARGLGQVCTVPLGLRTVTPRDRVADVLAAHDWLAARPDIDTARIVLWGFSHGGSTVLATLNAGRSAQSRFRQAIAFYPGCSAYAQAAARGERLRLAAPLQILIGEADDWTPAAPCHRYAEALQQAGQTASITGYPGAFHDFDNPAGRLRVRADVPNGVNPGQGVTVGPDPAAREDAKRRIEALLAAPAN